MPAPNAVLEAIGQTNGLAGLTQNSRGGLLARTGAGVYTLTLDRPLNIADCIIDLDDQGAVAPAVGVFNVAHTSDLVKTITRLVLPNGAAYAQGVATDGAFVWKVWALRDLMG